MPCKGTLLPVSATQSFLKRMGRLLSPGSKGGREQRNMGAVCRCCFACVAEGSGAKEPMIAVGGCAELHETLRYGKPHLGELQGLKTHAQMREGSQSGFRVE